MISCQLRMALIAVLVLSLASGAQSPNPPAAAAQRWKQHLLRKLLLPKRRPRRLRHPRLHRQVHRFPQREARKPPTSWSLLSANH